MSNLRTLSTTEELADFEVSLDHLLKHQLEDLEAESQIPDKFIALWNMWVKHSDDRSVVGLSALDER
jgi:hypothetical protein